VATAGRVGGASVGKGVKVGAGVNVSVGVGGMGVSVAVGIAAWDWVRAAKASAFAVPMICSTVRVGVAAGPQAGKMTSNKTESNKDHLLFIFSPFSFGLFWNPDPPAIFTDGIGFDVVFLDEAHHPLGCRQVVPQL